jgi:hypothetical protein
VVFIAQRPKFWRYKAEEEGRADTTWTGVCPACSPAVEAERLAFEKRTARRYKPTAPPKGEIDTAAADEGKEPDVGQLDLAGERDRDEYWK